MTASSSPTRIGRPSGPQVVGFGPGGPATCTQQSGGDARDGQLTGLRLQRGGLLHFAAMASGPSHRNAGGHISTELRINDRIRVPEVRLVGPNGETVGIVPTDQALKLAQEADLDLVEIAPQGKPPVCKLMDYGKFKYENAQKAREARRNQTNVIIKEMKLRPKIDAARLRDQEGSRRAVPQGRRQGQDHDHVPRSRAAPPRAGVPAAPAAGRGRHGARLRGSRRPSRTAPT